MFCFFANCIYVDFNKCKNIIFNFILIFRKIVFETCFISIYNDNFKMNIKLNFFYIIHQKSGSAEFSRTQPDMTKIDSQ